MRQGGVELAELVLADDGLVRGRDPAMELRPPAHEQRVVCDLLHDSVLEAVAALASLARRGLEHEIGGDELIDGVGEVVAACLAEHAIPEALSDDRRQLDALARRRRKTVDARGDDGVQRRRDLEHRRTVAEAPLAGLVARDRARLDERAQALLDEERVTARARDDAVS